NRDSRAKALSKILNGIDHGHRMAASEYHLGNVPAVRAIQKPVINFSPAHRRECWQSPWRVEQGHKPEDAIRQRPVQIGHHRSITSAIVLLRTYIRFFDYRTHDDGIKFYDGTEERCIWTGFDNAADRRHFDADDECLARLVVEAFPTETCPLC